MFEVHQLVQLHEHMPMIKPPQSPIYSLIIFCIKYQKLYGSPLSIIHTLYIPYINMAAMAIYVGASFIGCWVCWEGNHFSPTMWAPTKSPCTKCEPFLCQYKCAKMSYKDLKEY